MNNIEQEPKHIKNEYYVEHDYSWLAGPFDPTIKKHTAMLANVVSDMKRGKIDYRVTQDYKGRYMVERKGMILPKRK
jgi:hypothetical protein